MDVPSHSVAETPTIRSTRSRAKTRDRVNGGVGDRNRDVNGLAASHTEGAEVPAGVGW